MKRHSNGEGNDAADELANQGAKGHECRTHRRMGKNQTPKSSAKEHERINRAPQRPENPDHIRIPISSYEYGAIRRQRFACGRISAKQVRLNTSEQLRNITQPTEPELDVTPLPPNSVPEANSPGRPVQVTPGRSSGAEDDTTTSMGDPPVPPVVPSAAVVEFLLQEEEDMFQFDETLNLKDCA